MSTEQVVFVDETGKPTGEVGPKLASHTGDTKRHLAFSCYIFREGSAPHDPDFLLTRRALDKKVWPGVWTNSVCGHPAPGEGMEAAIRRRAAYELGVTALSGVQCLLPNYAYTSPPSNGIVENEFCPVYMAFTSQQPEPNPAEVADYRWLRWSEYATLLQAEPDTTSYWAKDQFPLLADKVIGPQ